MTVHGTRFSGIDLLTFYQKDSNNNNSGGLFCFAFLDDYRYMWKQQYVTTHAGFQLHLWKSTDAFVKNIYLGYLGLIGYHIFNYFP